MLEENYRIYRQMVNSLYEQEEKDREINNDVKNEIKIIPQLIHDNYDQKLKVEFQIGKDFFYKIKSISYFYDLMTNNEKYSYGKKLTFIHTYDAFEEDSRKLLDFIMKYGELIKYADTNSNRTFSGVSDKLIILAGVQLDEFFEIEKNKRVQVNKNGKNEILSFIDEEPKINFKVTEKSKDEYLLKTSYDIYNYQIIAGKDYYYLIENEQKMYRCTKKFNNTILKILNTFRRNFVKEIPFKKNEFSQIYSLAIQNYKNLINLDEVNNEEMQKYLPKKLKTRVFLDTDSNNNIICNVKFIYDDVEFDPFKTDNINKPRNIIEESKALDIIRDAGFQFDEVGEKLILAGDEKIYNFLNSYVKNFLDNFEVLISNNFSKIEIKKVQSYSTEIGVKIENNLLNIDLSKIEIDKSEIDEIMKKYKLKKKFHRLKNGSFINLQDNNLLNLIDELSESSNIEYKKLLTESINLPLYRSFYINKILNKNQVILKENSQYKEIVDNVEEKNVLNKYDLPKGINASLREYQKVGFEWLKTLDDYNLGGILADDMGLGKTLEILTVILYYIEECKKKNENILTSLVICPSSLSLNWESEAKKFTPSIKTIVINGSLEERKNKIKSISKYDLAIISYDLLKRDSEIFDEMNYKFRYIIVDEAQYIKNNKTQNAKVIKKLKSITRFALTGTPIENSLAELWSIVDFIMPGYLFNYNRFKINYEMPIIKENDETKINRLKEMLEPFILRRTKENVLTELPDKTITILRNEMEGEQLKLYLAYMQNAKNEAKEEIETNGIQNSQIKILALLMRLRQICCHPGLFLEDYEGESKKLQQCIEVIKTAIDGGHKILLFSGYSSMFPFIEKELMKLNIKYLILTGKTKVNERMEYVNEFNNNGDIKVFLISLKAGGTGLNLIGADMVIHYDPWWNLSAENQATDRTYRIGQKKNVQVYKLITKNSIEEKIYELQEKKAKLANDILSTNQTFISKLSEDEIMNLFE